MHNVVRIYALVALLSMISATCWSQVTRVAIDSPRNAKANYIDVYECDYVDVQPQFPGGDRAMVNFINKTRVYPYEAYQHKI